MKFWTLIAIGAALTVLSARSLADDVVTNIVSSVVSYQFYDDLAQAGNSSPIASPVASYQFQDSLGNGGADAILMSPITAYQYFDWGGEGLPSIDSLWVSYFFNSGESPKLTLTSVANTPAAVALAFNFPTDFSESYIFEYKKAMSEPFWRVWRLIVGDGQVKTIVEEAKLNQCLFIRGRTEANPIRFKFPLQGTFSPERISGYHQGDHWENKYCPEGSNRLLHIGLDFRATPSDTVYAVSTGTVRYARIDEKWGGYLVLETDSGYTVTYTHVIPSVSVGDKPSTADPIGSIASIADSHLHFQIRKKPFSNDELRIQLRGRLPENIPCVTVSGEDPDPAFPELFLDPEMIFWE